jgi:hypothetical protein
LEHPDLTEDGVIKANIRQDFYPPVVAFVSKGCTRCPEYMKRDDRRTVNGRANPNYGYCYRQNCNGNGILERGDQVKNYKDQGECKPCPANTVLNNAETRCV